MEAKTQAWEEFFKGMEKDFWLASRMFWQTMRQLRKGMTGPSQFVLGLDD